MEKKSFVKGAFILAVAGLIVKIIGAAYRIPLNNIVGVEGMGYYDIVYRYYSWLLVISSSGLPTAISKMVSERVTLGDYRGAKNVFRTAFWLLVGIGTVTTVIMFFGANALSSISYPADAGDEIAKQALSFRALAPSLLFVSVMCAYRGYLQGMQRMVGTAVSQVVEQVGKLAVGFSLAFALLPKGPEYAAMGALIGVSASELLALIVIFFVYLKNRNSMESQIARSEQGRITGFGSTAKKLLAIAIPVTIGASIMPITGIVDSALIIRLLEGIGFTIVEARNAYSLLYSFVTPIINMPAVLTVALAMSLVPAISANMAKKDYKGVRSASRTGMKLALIIGTPCAVGLFVLAKPILAMLFGSSLEPAELNLASELMKTACVGVVFLSLVQTLTGVLQGMGKPNVAVVNLLFGGILKVITMLILTRIPEINIQGAAVSTVVCYAAAGILDTVYMIRKTGMKVNLYDVFLKPILSSVVMGVVVQLVYNVLGGEGTAATIGSVIAGVAVYVVLVVVLKMFSREDLAFIPGGGKLERIIYRGKKK
ncbi:MAG: polysaccharide biosynthesis protein [Clostridia bacterium]|nr:polysaccharide biosynthesis protein [Clostridia bacterium]